MRVEWRSPQRVKGRGTIFPQPSLSPTSWEVSQAPDAPSPLLAVHSRVAHCWEPTHWPSSSMKPCCLAGRERHFQFSWPCFSQNGEVPSGASPKTFFISEGVQAWFSAREQHISLHAPLTLRPCHHCRASRGSPCQQQSQKKLLLKPQRQWLKQTAGADSDHYKR